MPIYRLIEQFENNTKLPIDLDAASSWIVQNGIQNEINFIPVELETGVIRGFVKRYKRHKGGWDPDPDLISDIYYAENQSHDWQNIVCAKELLHVLDGACVNSKEKFEKLTQRLSLPNDLQHLLEDPDYVMIDKFGTSPASALLLPMAARELLLPAYGQGLITASEIAKLAEMPVQHVRTVMSDSWPQIYELIKKI